MKIQIDHDSGFCSGVMRAIRMAEKELDHTGQLYCLGNIVHNPLELKRLQEKGLVIIGYDKFRLLRNSRVLIRAHGEPPEIFDVALENNLELLNATCPTVTRLQFNISKAVAATGPEGGSIIIFGKKEHPEVIALVGHTGGKAKVVRNSKELDNIRLTVPVFLYAQTTMNTGEFQKVADEIRRRIIQTGGDGGILLKVHDTICREVSCRLPNIMEFAKQHDLILFVSGRESSNGRMLFDACKTVNPNSHFISDLHDLHNVSFKDCLSIGISGATSTPPWLLKEVEIKTRELLKKN